MTLTELLAMWRCRKATPLCRLHALQNHAVLQGDTVSSSGAASCSVAVSSNVALSSSDTNACIGAGSSDTAVVKQQSGFPNHVFLPPFII